MNKTFFILSFSWRIARGLRPGNALAYLINQLQAGRSATVVFPIPQKKERYPAATVHYHSALDFYQACDQPAIVQRIGLEREPLEVMDAYQN